MKNTVRIALADQSTNNLLPLKTILKQITNYKVILEVINGQELFNSLGQSKPDVLLINFQMPIIKNLKSIQDFNRYFPDVRIILMAVYNNPLLLWSYINAGVNGILLQQPKPRQIKKTIDGVLQEGYYCSENILKSVAKLNTLKSAEAIDQFSKRELEVIQWICKEKTSAEIAQLLFISKRTVDWHRKEVMKRIGTKTSIGIVKYAISNGIFDVDKLK